MQVIHYTDPGCPFAFSSEPNRLLLEWHYGDQLEWKTVLIVLSSTPEQLEAKGATAAKMAGLYAKLHREHGMPFSVVERERLHVTRPACLAIAATQVHQPDAADALLRRLRVRTMGHGDQLLDLPSTIDGAARDVGIDPDELHRWVEDPDVIAALDADMAAARQPVPAAQVLDHKLAASEDGGRRYSAPSYELRAGDRVAAVPGFQPYPAYDVALANLDPSLTRRALPTEVEEVLAWVSMPLATAEVAALLGTGLDAARSKLEAAGASYEPVGEDGYWTAA